MSEVVGKKTQWLRERYGKTPEAYKIFACGFVAGQAEKVYLGACRAAMFRPGKENFEWHLAETTVIAEHFGLVVRILESHCPETPFEIWIHRPGTEIGSWLECEPNSPTWHSFRAAACGIPLMERDSKYHLRDGYGEKCD